MQLRMPGFTAEAALYRAGARNQYRPEFGAGHGANKHAVTPSVTLPPIGAGACGVLAYAGCWTVCHYESGFRECHCECPWSILYLPF